VPYTVFTDGATPATIIRAQSRRYRYKIPVPIFAESANFAKLYGGSCVNNTVLIGKRHGLPKKNVPLDRMSRPNFCAGRRFFCFGTPKDRSGIAAPQYNISAGDFESVGMALECVAGHIGVTIFEILPSVEICNACILNVKLCDTGILI
jgi:hypothetical protein